MKLDPALKTAIDSTDLSTWQSRRGATALAIMLMDRIYFAEMCEREELEIILIRSPTHFEKEYVGYKKNLNALLEASSLLYDAFRLNRHRRLGVSNYIRKFDDAWRSTTYTMPNPLYLDG